ncbi:hypothetical protein [Micromonospora endolithica]|uniref:Uncharacterized protein n=1 Tax=Micromonospora endolithica TaxID=230091 RepID=A0A3A9YSH9_9ACTN|nr:hypothetical protein [Micromonospora endolithica]RKN38454.1 hypothetical protein D7223_31100 [Micromonospora endolithica]TWJ23126.1 hypothetical protein JD76_03255 [Micromonospora endolithica]
MLAVDQAARTIAGLAVPYGPAARSGGRRWRYQPGSLRWAGPVPVLLDHVRALRVGWVLPLADTPTGLDVLLRIDRGELGDRVLAVAADGVYGMSPGVEMVEHRPDPTTPGVRLALAADLEEISLTRTPAFGGPP